jgi:hypothetical protein
MGEVPQAVQDKLKTLAGGPYVAQPYVATAGSKVENWAMLMVVYKARRDEHDILVRASERWALFICKECAQTFTEPKSAKRHHAQGRCNVVKHKQKLAEQAAAAAAAAADAEAPASVNTGVVATQLFLVPSSAPPSVASVLATGYVAVPAYARWERYHHTQSNALDKAIINYIADSNSPLSTVDSESFRLMMHVATTGQYQPFATSQLSQEFFPNIYNSVETEVCTCVRVHSSPL